MLYYLLTQITITPDNILSFLFGVLVVLLGLFILCDCLFGWGNIVVSFWRTKRKQNILDRLLGIFIFAPIIIALGIGTIAQYFYYKH